MAERAVDRAESDGRVTPWLKRGLSGIKLAREKSEVPQPDPDFPRCPEPEWQPPSIEPLTQQSQHPECSGDRDRTDDQWAGQGRPPRGSRAAARAERRE
jgi:hypothetical protein